MKMLKRTLRLSGLLALFVAALSGGLTAQEPEVELDRARLTEFARAHLAINEARDEFHGKVARVHDEEGRRRAREEVEARIDAILEEREMTRDMYDAITLRISLDGDLRAMFEEILVELATEGG